VPAPPEQLHACYDDVDVALGVQCVEETLNHPWFLLEEAAHHKNVNAFIALNRGFMRALERRFLEKPAAGLRPQCAPARRRQSHLSRPGHRRTSRSSASRAGPDDDGPHAPPALARHEVVA
jgi:hypothetical protein